MHTASTAVRIAASSWATRKKSQRRQGRSGGRRLLCNFLPTAYGGILSKRDHQSDHLFFKCAHTACNFPGRKMAGDATSVAARRKYARPFEVTGYKSLITGASRGAGKSFLHKRGLLSSGGKTTITGSGYESLPLQWDAVHMQSLLSCKLTHVITAMPLVSNMDVLLMIKTAGHSLKIFVLESRFLLRMKSNHV